MRQGLAIRPDPRGDKHYALSRNYAFDDAKYVETAQHSFLVEDCLQPVEHQKRLVLFDICANPVHQLRWRPRLRSDRRQSHVLNELTHVGSVEGTAKDTVVARLCDLGMILL